MPSSSDSIAQLAGALAKAQLELVNPVKTHIAVLNANGSGGKCYRYAPLSAGLDIVRKVLGKHEIAVIQTTDIEAEGSILVLTTTLAHASGEWISARWPVCTSADLSNPQLMGAGLTYARRYGLFTLAGLAGEEDLDAASFVQAEAGDHSDAFVSKALVVDPSSSEQAHAESALRSGQGLAASNLSRSEPHAGENRNRVKSGPTQDNGSHPPKRGKTSSAARIKPASAGTPDPDPTAGLALVEDADGLFQCALEVLPLRNTIDDVARAALDTAFLARAEAIGADPELLLPFRSGPAQAERDEVERMARA